jgi:hypothetical protein
MAFVLALACGIGLSLGTASLSGAAQETVGPVGFTVHAAVCPINYATLGTGGIYESCHGNGHAGVAFTFDSIEGDPVAFTTDAAGVGSGQILDAVASATGATLAIDAAALTDIGAYAYCKDQIGGLVLFDGTVPETGVIELGAVSTAQEIICDWYTYGPATEGQVEAVEEVVANG